MSRALEGKRIVVTGAGAGIGRAAWSQLEAHGAHVCGIDLQGDGVMIAADVRDAEAVARAVEEAAERLGEPRE